MTTFKSEKDKKEFVAAFKKMTMSGAVTRDQAIEKLIRKNPNYFHQPTEDELKKISHSEMNAAMRAGVQSNKISIDIFRRPTDKKPS
jgi:glutamyl-tRNA reductase